MTVLVVGASGATGRLLVKQLLDRGEKVKIIVRSTSYVPEFILNNENLSVVHANILDLEDAEMIRHIRGCTALASCLGHNLSLKGMFGAPRRLVRDATRRLCSAVTATGPAEPVRFVLMNTAGNSNRDLDEPMSFAQKLIIWLLRLLLPPHADNEAAADYLRTQIGQNDHDVQWAVVRPDSLIDEDEITRFDVHVSPTRSAIFDPGSTSRINVACFMADLIGDNDVWSAWKGKMPVIYNKELDLAAAEN